MPTCYIKTQLKKIFLESGCTSRQNKLKPQNVNQSTGSRKYNFSNRKVRLFTFTLSDNLNSSGAPNRQTCKSKEPIYLTEHTQKRFFKDRDECQPIQCGFICLFFFWYSFGLSGLKSYGGEFRICFTRCELDSERTIFQLYLRTILDSFDRSCYY